MGKNKANFILTKNNFGEFRKRFERLLSVTGMLSSQGIYNGIGCLSSLTGHPPIKETCVLYTDIEVVTYDTYPSTSQATRDNLKFESSSEGIIIRTGSDSCNVIYFGQKMKWTPTQLILINENPHTWRSDTTLPSMRTTFKPEYNTKKAKQNLFMEEQHSKAYWDSVEKEQMGEESMVSTSFSYTSLTGELPEGYTEDSVLANALHDWALCQLGGDIPEKFGEGMVKVSQLLGTATPDGLMELAKNR